MESRVIHGDSYEIIKILETNSIDVIITDPPYNATIRDRSVNVDGFRTIDEDWNIDYSIDWLDIVYDKLKSDATVLVCCSHHLLGKYLTYFQDDDRWRLRQILHWKKPNATPSVRKYYYFSIEYIVWATKGDTDKYIWHRDKAKLHTEYNGQFACHDTFFANFCQGKERYNHPCPKPLGLMEKIIDIHTNEGDVVLDPFAGTASTGVAAKKLGRKYILIEKEKKYIDIIHERLKQEYLF